VTLARSRLEAAILVVMAVVLAGYLWASRRHTTTLDRVGRDTNVLPVFDPARVRKIAISEGGASDSTLVLRRNLRSSDLHDYRIGALETAPNDRAEVDRAELASLLRTLDFSAFLRTMSRAQLPEDAFAPAAPKLVLEVEMDSATYRVVIGGPAASPAGARYAHTTGDDGTERAGVIPDSLAAALSKDAKHLRGRLLFPYGKTQTRSLSITRPPLTDSPAVQTLLVADALGFRVTQSAAETTLPGRPALSPARQLRADPARVDGLFFQLARASLDEYPDAARAPAQPPIVVVQVPESGPEVRLEIGGECAGHPGLMQVVRTSPDPLVGCTTQMLESALGPRDLVLHGPWPLAADEIDHVVIKEPKATLDLIRDGAAFRRITPDPGPVTLERGNEYLEELTDLVLADVPCGGDVVGTLRIVGQPEGTSGGRELSFTLSSDGDRSLLRREDDGVCLLLSERARWLLDPGAAWYESLEVMNVRPEDVQRLVTFGPRLGRQELRRQGDALELVGDEADPGLVDATLAALSPLRAIRITKASARPFEPRFELQVEARASGPFTLRIGPRVRGGYLAALGGRKTEFILAPEVVRTLETSVETLRPGRWDPTGFSDLSVSARGVTYRFQRLGGELVPSDDSPRELGSALVEALSRLSPIAAVREGVTSGTSSAGPTELRLEGVYDAGDGKPRTLTVTFGALSLHGDQLAVHMTIDGLSPQYYVDRAAVLAVLDLL